MPVASEAVLKHALSMGTTWPVGPAKSREPPKGAGRSATLLSDDPPHRGHRRAYPPAAPSGGRRGFGTVPSLLLVARARSAAPIAGTPPSAYLRLVLVR